MVVGTGSATPGTLLIAADGGWTPGPVIAPTLELLGSLSVGSAGMTIDADLSGSGQISMACGSALTVNNAAGYSGQVVVGSSEAFFAPAQGGGELLSADATFHLLDVSLAEAPPTFKVVMDPRLSPEWDVSGDGQGGTYLQVYAETWIGGSGPCYAAGTHIATPAGKVPVEVLRPGDMVLAQEGGTWAPRPVRWVGRTTVALDQHPEPHKAAPIRIATHAFAPGVPHRDLLVSADHAVLVDSVLMQAQALVNGATIRREPPRGRVTYVHVELDRHAILLAEGLPAESYLDTGNRSWFDAEAGVRPLFLDFATPRTWATDACLPLVLTGPQVKRAHLRLLARALQLGHRVTADPSPRLLADSRPVPLFASGAGRWCATLPPGARAVRLLSRSFVPDEFDRAADDRRRLGMAVASLRLSRRKLPDSAFGSGWHAAEPEWRWTDGDATLRLRPRRRAVLLTFRTIAAGPGYWQTPAVPERQVA